MLFYILHKFGIYGTPGSSGLSYHDKTRDVTLTLVMAISRLNFMNLNIKKLTQHRECANRIAHGKGTRLRREKYNRTTTLISQ